MRDITEGDADLWRLYLIDQQLAECTVRRRCGFAKQFFRAAMRLGLIASNPFVDLKSSIRTDHSKFFFVTRDNAEKILNACPDAEWRLIFALSRFAGMRCTSEHFSLTWADIDWDKDRFRVHSPKTKRHPGGEFRIVPIFPELRPHLVDAFELAEPGELCVIARNRNENLRDKMRAIIRKAGIEPWPKVFQNLRSTRETELVETFPLHVVTKWLGNSGAIAQKHYLQVTEDHFDKAVQNPVQQSHVETRNNPQGGETGSRNPMALQGVAKVCELLHNSLEDTACPEKRRFDDTDLHSVESSSRTS